MSRIAILCFAILASGAAFAQTPKYRLDSGDEIRLSLLENPQLAGTYVVADDGAIALPALGRVIVSGMTLEEATIAIREKITLRIVDPSIAIEISKYRPFFILGDVANPGMYPAAPGLTLVKAVAIAGGYRGRGDYFQTTVSGIRAAENLAVARRQLLQARMQAARLEAELRSARNFAVPEGIGAVEEAAMREIIAREHDILATHVDAAARQLELLENERRIRDEEIAALRSRIETQAQETESIKAEVKEVQDMVRRGLAPSSRLTSLTREEMRARSDALQTTVLLNQARQARNQVDMQLSTLEQARRTRILNELQEAAARVQRLRRQAQAEEAVLLEANALDDGGESGRTVRIVFHLRRRDGSEAKDIEADNADVQPGDVVRVERRLVRSEGRR